MIFVWFHCVCTLFLLAGALLCSSPFVCVCTCAFAAMLLFHHFMGSRNCLLDYICFSNWYIVTHDAFFVVVHSGLLILHFCFRCMMCYNSRTVLSCVWNVASCKHDLPTFEQQWNLPYAHTHARESTPTNKWWKKCGKPVAYFIRIITVHREFIVKDLSEMCHNEKYFGTVNQSKPTIEKKEMKLHAKCVQHVGLGTHAAWNGKCCGGWMEEKVFEFLLEWTLIDFSEMVTNSWVNRVLRAENWTKYFFACLLKIVCVCVCPIQTCVHNRSIDKDSRNSSYSIGNCFWLSTQQKMTDQNETKFHVNLLV